MIRKNLIKEKKGISPIIATLLLILIAIAAGVIVYAYVIGFIGNSTSNPGGATSVLQISNFCASSGTKCNGIDAYSISILNTGSTSLSSATVQVYFQDITASTSASTTCSVTAAPGATASCVATAWPTGISPTSGDEITVKVVAPDGGSSTSTTKAI